MPPVSVAATPLTTLFFLYLAAAVLHSICSRSGASLGVDMAGEERLQRSTAAHAHFVRLYRTLDRVQREFYDDSAIQARAAILSTLLEAYLADRRVS